MLTPAAGALLLGGPVTPLTDRHVDVADVPRLDAEGLASRCAS